LIRSDVFEEISETLLSVFSGRSEVVFIELVYFVQTSPKLKVKSSQRPRSVGLVFIKSRVVHSVVKYDLSFLICNSLFPTSEKETTQIFVLNRFLLGLHFKYDTPFKQLVMKHLEVSSYVVTRFTNIFIILLHLQQFLPLSIFIRLLIFFKLTF
jgi:hypothetical protein